MGAGGSAEPSSLLSAFRVLPAILACATSDELQITVSPSGCAWSLSEQGEADTFTKPCLPAQGMTLASRACRPPGLHVLSEPRVGGAEAARFPQGCTSPGAKGRAGLCCPGEGWLRRATAASTLSPHSRGSRLWTSPWSG